MLLLGTRIWYTVEVVTLSNIYYIGHIIVVVIVTNLSDWFRLLNQDYLSFLSYHHSGCETPASAPFAAFSVSCFGHRLSRDGVERDSSNSRL